MGNTFKPSIRQLQSGAFKLDGGVWHKLCTGPAHDEPTYLPANEKYFYVHKSGPREGTFLSRCRLCNNWNKIVDKSHNNRGYVRVSAVYKFYVEAVNRIGLLELSRRTGVSQSGLENVIYRRQEFVKKEPLRKVMLELTSLQRKGENSIRPSARWRAHRRNTAGVKTCSGCGTPIHNFTTDCRVCDDRKLKREKRAS